MSDVALRTCGLGKMYHIGGERETYRTLRDTIMQAAKRPFERVRHPGATTHTSEELWALKDIDAEVRHGEVLGVIGRNGSGKSTLLKVLSHITEPTEGTADVRGRVASLLEVGTGFHPELTGRENILLNGAILGMARAEIKRKLDDIVEFSEIGRFLDTPVKRYSSGMYVRLAFAVAAHLEPEILLVDEVLAVGDAKFQRKCLHRMDQIGHEGRTVLFVSHNLSSVARLCSRAILLDGGRLAAQGPVAEVVEGYLTEGVGLFGIRDWTETDSDERPGDDLVKLLRVHLEVDGNIGATLVEVKSPIQLTLEYEVLAGGCELVPNFHVFTGGTRAFAAVDTDPAWQGLRRPPGRYRTTAVIPGNLLSEGIMTVDVGVSTFHPNVAHARAEEALAFQVYDEGTGDSARGAYAEPLPGAVRPMLEWSTSPSPAAATRTIRVRP